MGRFREKIYRFMYGRYGTDNLYYFLMIAFFVLMVVEMITVAILPEGLAETVVSIVFFAITWGIVIYMTFRLMSRNIYKRRCENEAYLRIRRSISRFFNMNTSTRTKSRNVDNAEFIFRDCTKCGATLRLPRKSGKHGVKCPRCTHSFFVKSK